MGDNVVVLYGVDGPAHFADTDCSGAETEDLKGCFTWVRHRNLHPGVPLADQNPADYAAKYCGCHGSNYCGQDVTFTPVSLYAGRRELYAALAQMMRDEPRKDVTNEGEWYHWKKVHENERDDFDQYLMQLEADAAYDAEYRALMKDAVQDAIQDAIQDDVQDAAVLSRADLLAMFDRWVNFTSLEYMDRTQL